MTQALLVRYGAIPEIARFEHDFAEPPRRNEKVVIQTRRGLELGTAIDAANQPNNGSPPGDDSAENDLLPSEFRVVRAAGVDDESRYTELHRDAQSTFAQWRQRIADWKINLDLIDLEWTLDKQKLVLYLLGAAGGETTKLTLRAAAAGFPAVEIQLVDANGPVTVSTGGGCSTGGCGCSTKK